MSKISLSYSLPSYSTVRIGYRYSNLKDQRLSLKKKVVLVTKNGFYYEQRKGRTRVYVSFRKKGIQLFKRETEPGAFELRVASRDVQEAMFAHATLENSRMH